MAERWCKSADRADRRKLYNPDYKNFAPRVAFAWDATGKGTTVLRAGYGIFYDAFSQDMFLGHLPYNCTFCPGPAYTGVGAAPITFFSATSGPIAAGSPVFVNGSPLSSFFGIDPNIRTPYVQNWNVNIQQAFGNKTTAESRLRRLEGHAAVPLPRYQSAQPGADHGI